MSSCWLDLQLSLVTGANPAGPLRLIIGSLNRLERPNRASEGPRARTRTRLGEVPVIINPPMPTCSAVSTRIRAESLTVCEAGGVVSATEMAPPGHNDVDKYR